ncbi:hypothetical protein DSECCO2_187890 [anaerobic digester metagenome]
MMSLMNYEMKKLLKNAKWALVAIAVLSVFFLISGYFGSQRLVWDDSLPSQILAMVSFMGLGMLMLVLFFAPFVICIVSYHKDLNAPHAVFEAYIPESGLKRLTAKYVSYFLLILAGIIISGLIALGTFLVIKQGAPEQIRFEIDNTILETLRQQNHNSFTAVLEFGRYLIGSALGMTISSVFFTFFITLQSVLRHRIKGATPITFLAAAAAGIGLGFLEEQLFERITLFQGNLMGISLQHWFSLLVSLTALLIMSWFLQHKTELK